VDLGDVLGDFRIVKKIGEGGMGVVYLAEDERLNRRVALKVIAPHLARDGDFRQRFIAEARNAAAIDDANVVTVYSSGTVDGNLYIAMRYIEGIDLRSALREEGPLDAETAVEIVSEVAGALDAAHAAGMVHRDVKPGNILLEAEPGDRKSYLTDFGLTKGGSESGAQLTGTGQWVGTIDYVAPEQIQAGMIDARTDVYALGCVLYETLTGTVPFAGNDMQKMWGHVNEPFPALDDAEAAHDLGSVVERATAKDPGDRFPSAGDLARAASAALEGTKVDTPERSVATGPAAKGLPEEAAPTRKLSKPGLAPTVTGRSPLPPRREPPPRPAATPPPREPPRRRSTDGPSSTRTAAIIGGAVVIAAGLLAAAVVIAGQDSSPSSSTTTPVASARGGSQSQQSSSPQTSPQTTTQPSTQLPSDTRPCTADVSVKTATTSCVFGVDVAREYRRSGGAAEVVAYSPKTEQSYTMTCGGSAPVICTGGEEAVVYIGN
jgi:serine/threonine protein kinase